jgi:hypothetical protein
MKAEVKAEAIKISRHVLYMSYIRLSFDWTIEL